MTAEVAHVSGGGDVPAQPKSSRRGSETRQKQRRFTFRMSQDEFQKIEAYAEREGLTVGSYVRSRILTAPTTRAIRRPVVEVKMLTAMLAELHKIGSNINQIARRVNHGDTPLSQEIELTFAACRRIAEQAKDALDRNSR